VERVTQAKLEEPNVLGYYVPSSSLAVPHRRRLRHTILQIYHAVSGALQKLDSKNLHVHWQLLLINEKERDGYRGAMFTSNNDYRINT
jgi:hypothetical protein